MSASPPTKFSSGKPRGRPKVEERAGSSVTTWLRVREHDRLIQLANRDRKSLSALVRDLIKLKLG